MSLVLCILTPELNLHSFIPIIVAIDKTRWFYDFGQNAKSLFHKVNYYQKSPHT